MSRTRRKVYRAGSLLGDIEAVASLSPTRILKRAANKVWGRKVIRKLWLK